MRAGAPCEPKWISSSPLSPLELYTKVDDRRDRYRQNANLQIPTLRTPPSTVTLDDVRAIKTPVCVVAGAESPAPHSDLARLDGPTLQRGLSHTHLQ